MPARLGSTTHSYSGDVVAVASQTVSIPVPTGVYRLLTVGIVGRNLATSSNNSHTVTWNGNSLTMLGSVTIGSGNFDYAELWYLLESGLSTATANLVVTNSPNNQVISLGAQVWGGVDQGTPFGAVVSFHNGAGDTTPTLTPTTIIGSEAIDVLALYIPSSPTLTEAATLMWKEVDSSLNEDSSGQQSKTATTTATTLNWTVNTASEWWMLATSINPFLDLMGQSRQQFVMGLGA